jgi:hypothetical protein
MCRKISRWNLRRASDKAIPKQAPGMGEGVETGWRASDEDEGTVRLSSKGESDCIAQRLAVQIRSRYHEHHCRNAVASAQAQSYTNYHSKSDDSAAKTSAINAKGDIFHTYGAFGRGSEQFMGIYGYFDVLPKGREEYGPTHALPDWAKVHDQYESDGDDKAACGCA